MAMATLINDVDLEQANSFRILVHYCHDRKHDNIQADMVLEELRILQLDPAS